MENPYTLKADAEGKNNAVMISKPEHYWEKIGWWVNEGPAVLYHMVYHATPTPDFDDSPRLTYIKPLEFAFGKPLF